VIDCCWDNAGVSDLVKRLSDTVASTAGGTMGSAVTAMMTTAALVTKDPTLALLAAPSGAFADAVTEQGVQLITKAFFDPAERVKRLADAIADESGQPTEDFITEHVIDGAQRHLLGVVTEAATVAQSDWKIRVLARAFVHGIKEDGAIDETEMFVKATRLLEPRHVRVLAAAIHIMTKNRPGFVNTETLKEYDNGIGIAAPILWRDLVEQGFLTEINTRGNKPKGGVLLSHETKEGFVPTDLGYASGEWFTSLDAEVTVSDPT